VCIRENNISQEMFVEKNHKPKCISNNSSISDTCSDNLRYYTLTSRFNIRPSIIKRACNNFNFNRYDFKYKNINVNIFNSKSKNSFMKPQDLTVTQDYDFRDKNILEMNIYNQTKKYTCDYFYFPQSHPTFIYGRFQAVWKNFNALPENKLNIYSHAEFCQIPLRGSSFNSIIYTPKYIFSIWFEWRHRGVDIGYECTLHLDKYDRNSLYYNTTEPERRIGVFKKKFQYIFNLKIRLKRSFGWYFSFYECYTAYDYHKKTVKLFMVLYTGIGKIISEYKLNIFQFIYSVPKINRCSFCDLEIINYNSV